MATIKLDIDDSENSVIPVCWDCENLILPSKRSKFICSVYPAGIPKDIWEGGSCNKNTPILLKE